MAEETANCAPVRGVIWDAPVSWKVVTLTATMMVATGATLGRNTERQELGARAIITRAIELNGYGLSPVRDYTFKFRSEGRKVDKKRETKTQNSKTCEVIVLYGEPAKHLIASNDKPLEKEEVEKEHKRYEKKVRSLAKKSEAQRAQDTERARVKVEKERAFLREIPEVYDLKLFGEEQIEGRSAYLIEAIPRAGAKIRSKGPEGNLLKLYGRLWIDKQDGQWVRVEAEARKNLNYGVFLASVKTSSRIVFEQTRIDEGVLVAQADQWRTTGKVFGTSLRSSERYDLFRLQKISQ